ncbi:hypothetical protein ACWCWD_06470 [Streptomyces sp. NPDC001493]
MSDRIPLDDLTSDQLDALYDRINLLERGARERSALLEEARDALEAAGASEAHGGEHWPRLVPAIEQLAARITELEAEAVEHLAAHEQEVANTVAEIDRAVASEATLARVRRLLERGPIGTCCDRYVRAALDAPPPTTT